MERSMYDDHLAQAARHVGEGEQRVADQRRRMAQLAQDGHDTTAAEALLVTLEHTLTAIREHQQQILQEQANPPRSG